MAKAIHHVTVLTQDTARLEKFLTSVIGMPVVARHQVARDALGPLFRGTDVLEVTSTMFGSAPYGLVEVLEVTKGVTPGLASSRWAGAGVLSLSFNVHDLNGTLEAARSSGFGNINGPSILRFGNRDVAVAAVSVESVVFQITQVLPVLDSRSK